MLRVPTWLWWLARKGGLWMKVVTICTVLDDGVLYTVGARPHAALVPASDLPWAWLTGIMLTVVCLLVLMLSLRMLSRERATSQQTTQSG